MGSESIDPAGQRKELYIPRDEITGKPLPLTRASTATGDHPLPDPDAKGRAHTTLGGKVSEKTGELYRQSATFPEHQLDVPKYAVPQYEVDWGTHGLPDHPNPHMHKWELDYDTISEPWRKGSQETFPPWQPNENQ